MPAANLTARARRTARRNPIMARFPSWRRRAFPLDRGQSRMSGKSRTARRNPTAGPGGQRQAARKQAQRRAQRRHRAITWGGIAAGMAAIVAVLYVIFSGGSSTAGAGKYPYQAGSPGAGQAAPGFTLPATTGEQISL